MTSKFVSYIFTMHFRLLFTFILNSILLDADQKVVLHFIKYGKDHLITGEKCLFTCEFHQFGQIIGKSDVKFTRNGVPVLASQFHKITTESSTINNNLSVHKLRITKLIAEDEGNYSCEYFRDADFKSNTEILKVWPSFREPICSRSKTFYFIGETVRLSCQAYSYEQLDMIWNPPVETNVIKMVKNSFTTEQISFKAEGEPRHKVQICYYNGLGRGNELKSCRFDFVIKRYVKVTISNILIGQAMKFQCIADGDIDFIYNWTLNNSMLSELQSINNSLIIDNVTDEMNGGNLSCMVVGTYAEGYASVILNFDLPTTTAISTVIMDNTSYSYKQLITAEMLQDSEEVLTKTHEVLLMVGCTSLVFTLVILLVFCVIIRKRIKNKNTNKKQHFYGGKKESDFKSLTKTKENSLTIKSNTQEYQSNTAQRVNKFSINRSIKGHIYDDACYSPYYINDANTTRHIYTRSLADLCNDEFLPMYENSIAQQDKTSQSKLNDPSIEHIYLAVK